MRAIALVACLSLSAVYAAEPALTLEAALATVDSPHPKMQAAQAGLDLALAEQQITDSSNDLTLTLGGALLEGKPSDSSANWQSNNNVRLVARKTLLDFGREQGFVEAAKQEVKVRQLALLDARDAQRIDIMARYFDVLLTDAQTAADNEYTAVYYLSWDDAKKRFDLGELNNRDLTQLEARYQDQREKRNRNQTLQRSHRQKLANAMNRPEHLPGILDMPRLPQNNLILPEYHDLLPLALQRNRKLQALQAQLDGVASRTHAIRASHSPTVDLELSASSYSRDISTRDQYSGGLILHWPIYQGERLDGKLARESSERKRIEAETEQLKRDLAEHVLETWLEIDWLKNTARPAAQVQINYRDQALERARAEYEMEMKTTLGTAMADTQTANLRSQQVEFRLALAIARLEAMLGQPLTEITHPPPAEKK